jgi:hypothetical protein
MSTTRFGLAAAVGMALLLPLGVAGDERESGEKKAGRGDDKASVWMTKKLDFSQKILQGLTKGDFELVRKNADAMIVVGYLEKWDRAAIPTYRQQMKAFEEANKDLIRQADKEDVQAATRAYTKLVVSCVECHTVVRDAKKK